MPPVAFAAYSPGLVLAVLHQAPIGIKMSDRCSGHPFRLWRTRISSVPYRVQGRVTILMVFCHHCRAHGMDSNGETLAVSGLGRLNHSIVTGSPQPLVWFAVPPDSYPNSFASSYGTWSLMI